MRDPLVLPLAAFCAGLVLAKWAGLQAAELIPAAALFSLLALAAWRARSPRLAKFCLLLAVGAGGAARFASRRDATPPEVPPPGIHALEGCAVTAAEVRNGRERFVLELPSGAAVRLSRAAAGASGEPVRAGDRVIATARITEPSGYRNPGAFDYSAWLRRRGIFATGVVVRGSDFRAVPAGCPQTWRTRIQNLRAAALRKLDRIYSGNPYAQGMMRGLLLGDSSGIRDAWVEGFRRTGTFHALVISGSHVTFLAGLLLFWIRWIRFGRGFTLAGAAALAWLYALVAGADPPVIRAAAGFSLYAAASLVFRPTRLLNLTAGIALIFLALDPQQLFEASFQLSFLAVAAIGAFAQPLLATTSAVWREAVAKGRGPWPLVPANPSSASLRVELQLVAETLRVWTGLPLKWCWRAVRSAALGAAFVWETAVVSGVIQIALALPMIVYFHRLSISGLSANVLAVPFVTLAIPAGFLALFTSWQWAAECALALLETGRRIIEWHARWEPDWRIPDPPAALALAFCASLAALAFALRRRSLWSLPAGAAVAASLALMAAAPLRPRAGQGRFELTAIDVGQGESFFLALPGGAAALIDTGGLPNWSGRASEFDIGEEVVSPYLWSRGLRRLDLLVLTHFHYDHAGGAPSVIRNFRPRKLWIPDLEESPEDAPVLLAARRAGAEIVRLRQGGRMEFGGVRWEVIAPLSTPGARAERNNQSLVLRLTHGANAFLMTADAEAATQARLLEAGLLERAAVLKVPHHGSRRASLPQLLDAVRPAFAVISAGRGNRFGHPHPEVLDALAARRATVLRTDAAGLVTIFSDGRRLEIGGRSSRGWLEQAWDPLD
jgi:competence protein ComEC